MKLLYILLFLFGGTLQLTYGQNKTCRPTKISIYQGVDTTLSQMYEIVYVGGKVAYINHHKFDKSPEKTQIKRWDFVRQQDLTLVIAGKDTLYKIFYDTQGKVDTFVTKYHLLIENHVLEYDKQNRLTRCVAKEPHDRETLGKTELKFNYESEQEMSFSSSHWTRKTKYVRVFDTKLTPFYAYLELSFLFGSVQHTTPHNIISEYSFDGYTVTKSENTYQYHPMGYPIRKVSQTYYPNTSNTFYVKTLYEYDCK
jgi:hypothetical protein